MVKSAQLKKSSKITMVQSELKTIDLESRQKPKPLSSRNILYICGDHFTSETCRH